MDNMFVSFCRVVFANICFAICCCSVHAQEVLKLKAGLSISADDNFLRGASGTEVSERITVQNVGVSLSVPYSLQRFELEASLANNLHREFTSFDFTGQNYNASWLWSVTPSLHGSLTSVRTESLNAAGDSLNPGLRNKNVTNTNGVQAVYELGGPFQLLAGLTSSSSTNEQSLLGQATESKSTMFNMGVGYSLATGSSVKYNLRHGNGTNNTLISNAYKLTSHDVSMAWILTGSSTLNARIAYFEQHFDQSSQQDSNGFTGGANLVWRLSGKTTLNAGLQRESTVGGTLAQTDSLTIGPSWQVSPKTSLGLQYRNALRDDKGSSAGSFSNRQDRMQDTNLSLTWQPIPLVGVVASLGHFTRTSSLPNQDYVARVATLSAQLAF